MIEDLDAFITYCLHKKQPKVVIERYLRSKQGVNVDLIKGRINGIYQDVKRTRDKRYKWVVSTPESVYYEIQGDFQID